MRKEKTSLRSRPAIGF